MIIWSPGMSLEDIEEKVIYSAYGFFNKNIETTAKSLKVSVDFLNKKMSKYQEKNRKLNLIKEEEKIKNQEFSIKSRGFRNEIFSNPPNR